MKKLTTKLSNKSEWNQDAMSKLNRNASKSYADGVRMAETTGIFGPKTKYFESLRKHFGETLGNFWRNFSFFTS